MPTSDSDRLEAILGGRTLEDASAVEVEINRLIAAAQESGTASELEGLGAALAAFAARPEFVPPDVVPPDDALQSRRVARRAAAITVAAVLVVGSGGMAAAAAGHLPASLQRLADTALGVSSSDEEPGDAAAVSTPPVPAVERTPSSLIPTPDPAATPPPTGTPRAGTVGKSAVGLCRAWRAADGHASETAASVRALTALAGSKAGIAEFCAPLLASVSKTPPGPPATLPGKSASPTPPGQAKPKPSAAQSSKPTRTPQPKAKSSLKSSRSKGPDNPSRP